MDKKQLYLKYVEVKYGELGSDIQKLLEHLADAYSEGTMDGLLEGFIDTQVTKATALIGALDAEKITRGEQLNQQKVAFEAASSLFPELAGAKRDLIR